MPVNTRTQVNPPVPPSFEAGLVNTLMMPPPPPARRVLAEISASGEDVDDGVARAKNVSADTSAACALASARACSPHLASSGLWPVTIVSTVTWPSASPAANIREVAAFAAPTAEVKGFNAVQLMLLPTPRLLPPLVLLLPPLLVHSPIFLPLLTLQNLTTSNAAVAITPQHAVKAVMTSL